MRYALTILLLLAAAFLVALALSSTTSISPAALELRDRGFAELENERPEAAEKAYLELVKLLPDDPLGWGNLAIARLRQQKYAEATAAIETALKKAPGNGSLLAIKAEIFQWQGDLESGLELMKQAVKAEPDNLEILYSTYQMATTVDGETSAALAGEVLGHLARLRPENVVVLMQLGQKAIAEKNRETATGVFVRVAQLLWQADPMAAKALQIVNESLRQDDLESARVPALRLENVLKITPMFREGLRELKTGIQGIPLQEFTDEPENDAFGDPLAITLLGKSLDDRPGLAVVVGDFDGDGRADIARLRTALQDTAAQDIGGSNGSMSEVVLEVRRAAEEWKVAKEYSAAGLEALIATDLDNDGHLDLVAAGPERGAVWRGAGDGSFVDATEAFGLSAARANALEVIDYDIEGDLDLVSSGAARGIDLWRNTLQGPLESVGNRTFPGFAEEKPQDLFASDLDRDGDLDLVVAHGSGLRWLDNLRQGRFQDRSIEAGLDAEGSALRAVVSADLDNDGLPDLVAVGEGFVAWHNLGGRFERWALRLPKPEIEAQGSFSDLLAIDADNDGRLDLVIAGSEGVQVLQQQDDGSFTTVPLEKVPASVRSLASADFDKDGDLDLVTSGPAGLHWLENRGGNENGWLALRLRGLDKGNSKNNFHGVGSLVEVRDGRAYQFREATGDVVHIGLGKRKAAKVLRVVWTNGVPQNRIELAGNQQVVEEQLLKGSCPFLYAWDGERFSFVTDLLWGAPLGLPVAPGVWASSDPSELVRIDGLVPREGVYDLRITEELWEAAFFDYLRLWVVDHPTEVEVASNLRVIPGQSLPEHVHGSRSLRPVAIAWDGQGREVTAEVRHRDEVYADGYVESRYQGVAAKPWTFTFDLGEVPNAEVRLHLDGWIFPADASLNLAVAQRDDLPYLPPRLEVKTSNGWQVLMESTGFPAGKTKTLVLDLPPLPVGSHELRLVSSLWLHWDRIAWTVDKADAEAIIQAQMLPTSAHLRYRGFSKMVRQAPNAPHGYDYTRQRVESPWLPFPGNYTRFGDVLPLLETPDDFTVILAPGDEIALEFDARHLPPPAPGYQRTLFLESHGWDKDADRNTFAPQQMEPLPFRAMSGYPFGEGEHFPDTAAHRAYREEWLVREVR
jgi:cytochrome c-type biogenesis protein CcmH/NrfG